MRVRSKSAILELGVKVAVIRAQHCLHPQKWSYLFRSTLPLHRWILDHHRHFRALRLQAIRMFRKRQNLVLQWEGKHPQKQHETRPREQNSAIIGTEGDLRVKGLQNRASMQINPLYESGWTLLLPHYTPLSESNGRNSGQSAWGETIMASKGGEFAGCLMEKYMRTGGRFLSHLSMKN